MYTYVIIAHKYFNDNLSNYRALGLCFLAAKGGKVTNTFSPWCFMVAFMVKTLVV